MREGEEGREDAGGEDGRPGARAAAPQRTRLLLLRDHHDLRLLLHDGHLRKEGKGG